MIVALHEADFSFGPSPMVFAENTIVGSTDYEAEDFRQVISAMANGAYDTSGGWRGLGSTTSPTLPDLRKGRRMKVLVAP